MPIYSYKCESCGAKFEKLVSRFEGTGASTCSCGFEAHRVFSVGGFVLKGKDWPGRDIRRGGQGEKDGE